VCVLNNNLNWVAEIDAIQASKSSFVMLSVEPLLDNVVISGDG